MYMVETSVSKQVYVGDGVTTHFPFPFPFESVDDVKVALYDIPTEIETQLTSDYFVDSNASEVIYPGYPPGEEPPESDQPPVLPSTKKIVIYRDTPISQLEDLGQKYPLPIIEDMVDKATMILQEQSEKLGRAVLVEMGGDKTPQDISYDITHLKEYRDEAYASKVAAAASATTASQKATAAANSATAAANSATTTAGYKASVESTVNSFNSTVTTAVNTAVAAATQNAQTLLNNAVSAATADALGYANSASTSATAAANSANAAAQSAQQGESVLASAAQYARQAAQDAAGIHASAIPAWDADTVYSYPDVVAYTDGGTYRCIGEDVEAGTLPTDRDNWVLIAAVNGDDFFEIDLWGGLQPREYPSYSSSWELDDDDNITTKGA